MSELHRDHPEASEQEIEILAAAQMRGQAKSDDVAKSCRNCGEPFTVRAKDAEKNTKWYSLCSTCLSYEI